MPSVENLLDVLRKNREASGKELAALLGISQPTLSRLVKAAANRVCRLGKARATRYTLRRSIPNLGTRLPVRKVDENGKIQPLGFVHLLTNGRHWLERTDGKGEIFEGLPPFARDMSPQGYIGRNFPALYPELDLPPRISNWNDDHCLIALARRGEDCVGNLILGDESFSRFLASSPHQVTRAEYPECAQRSLQGQAGSSAGGEHPKFGVYTENRHVLVKFAGGEVGLITQRWQDLLTCERYALETIRAAGIPAASADVFDIEGFRFLEVERFDRVGQRGRKGIVSLYALGAEYLGYLDNWTKASVDLFMAERIDRDDAQKIRWLDVFGQLIGNNDRHFGNLSFFAGEGKLQLAPIYDMLPMIFAPKDSNLVKRRFDPVPPSAENFEVWSDAAGHALQFWERVVGSSELSSEFRDLCQSCRDAVNEILRKRGPIL